MNLTDLKIAVALGEDSSRQFKADVRNSDSLVSEMAAFANSNGGTILIGVVDDGSLPGLSGEASGKRRERYCWQFNKITRLPFPN